MASRVTESTVVSITSTDEGGGGRGSSVIMELAAKEGTATEKYFRVHASKPYTLTFSTGTCTRFGTGVKKCIQYVSFNGTSDESIRYPNPTSVNLNVIGNLVGKDGNNATARYDPITKSVRADRLCFGIVKVTYESGYDMWKATFARASGI